MSQKRQIHTTTLLHTKLTHIFLQIYQPHIEKRFDTSDYSTNHPSGIKTGLNSKVLGMFKDEAGGKQIVEFVGLRAVLLNKPLSYLEIIDAAKKLSLYGFRGVFLRDTVPKNAKLHECNILNLDSSSGDGTHWVVWFTKGKDKFYFDSYGVQPPSELIVYIKSPIFCNSERVQQNCEVFCGHLCLFALKQLSLGNSLQAVINYLI